VRPVDGEIFSSSQRNDSVSSPEIQSCDAQLMSTACVKNVAWRIQFWQYTTYGDIQRDYRELVLNTDPPHLFSLWLVQHCSAILAIAELLFVMILSVDQDLCGYPSAFSTIY